MAAAVVALQSGSPYKLKYLVTGNDGDTVNLDAAGAGSPDLYTDLDGGAFKRLLAAAVADQAAARTMAYSKYIRFAQMGENTGWLIVVPDVTAPNGKLRLTITCVDTVRSILIIEFIHSAGR